MPARHGPRTPHDGPCARPQSAPSTAFVLGCRCPRCREWHRAYEAKRRGPDHVRRDQRPAYPGAVEAGCAHPTIGVWRSYQAGCRCVRCVNGCRRYWRQRYERIASRRPKVRSDFAKRLAYSLKERGMDAAALAGFVGVRKQTVAAWLRGENPPRSTLVPRIAKGLWIKTKFFTETTE